MWCRLFVARRPETMQNRRPQRHDRLKPSHDAEAQSATSQPRSQPSFRLPQIGEKRVAQVKIALDVPAAFILEFAGAIKMVDELPLRFDQ